MPKSKRDKKISLTQTNKKGLDLKKKLVEDIQACVDKYPRIFVFNVENMRNNLLKVVRNEWRHSRFFFGKNKVMSLALGQLPETEYRDNLHRVSQQLRGQVGLLFTNQTYDQVNQWFLEYSEPDFARSGIEASQTVVVEAGPLAPFSHSMEPQLRQLGLPTKLQKGTVVLTEDYQICAKGQTLTPEQARILKLFGHKMSTFRVFLESMWSSEGTFESLSSTQSIQTVCSQVKLVVQDDESQPVFKAVAVSDEEEMAESDSEDSEE